jgi:hypothetical protein
MAEQKTRVICVGEVMVELSRGNDGRYGMAFGVTTLLLMPEQVGAYISWGYDSR